MDIKMANSVQINPIDLVLKAITVAFLAGGMYFMVSTNTDNINLMRVELKQAIESQAKSNNGLSKSILDLNISLATLTNSLKYRDMDVAELKQDLRDVQSRLNALEKQD
ncbi:hypothetical protein VPHD63_0043 [Vibrio phage D63]